MLSKNSYFFHFLVVQVEAEEESFLAEPLGMGVVHFFLHPLRLVEGAGF